MFEEWKNYVRVMTSCDDENDIGVGLLLYIAAIPAVGASIGVGCTFQGTAVRVAVGIVSFPVMYGVFLFIIVPILIGVLYAMKVAKDRMFQVINRWVS